MKSHYSVLGLPDFAPLSEIKRAYREQALMSHPDKQEHNEEVSLSHELRDLSSSLRPINIYCRRKRSTTSSSEVKRESYLDVLVEPEYE